MMKLRTEPETLIKSVSEMLHEFGVSSVDAAEGIEYILDKKLWKKRDPSPGLLKYRSFKYFPEFCEAPAPWGLRTSYATVIDVCKRDDRIYQKVVEAGNVGRGANQHTLEMGNNNIIIHKAKQGTSKAYGLTRLKKYRKDLHRAVLNGEMSVNEAMIEAGFRDKTYTVKAEPDYIINFIQKHFSSKDRKYISGEII